MIKTWRNSGTERFARSGKSKFPGMDVDKAIEALNVLDAATSLQSISPLRSVGLHKLKGGRKGQWAMTINGPWRLVFRFRDGNAYDVEITDYH